MDKHADSNGAATAGQNEPTSETSTVALDQSDDEALVRALTAVVRSADDTFQRTGGSSRHWVRDCFLPTLNHAGWLLVTAAEVIQVCRHCGEDIRFLDGGWMDRETHHTCPMPEDGPDVRHEPRLPLVGEAGSAPVIPTDAERKTKDSTSDALPETPHEKR